ncbi:MAG: glutamate--tRNA ligase [Pseudomonadota bacterium]
MTVRTRFAPSPTGVLHLGSVRTALYCWLYARKHGGEFVLRIEDTDRERSTPENVAAIIDGMTWLGLTPDVGPVSQTDRFDRYRDVIAQWIDEGKAYYCYATKEELAALRERQMAEGVKTRYDGRWRDRTETREGVDPVVRFKNPTSGEVVVDDLVKGRVVFDNAELDDLIIARSNGDPTYNFTVVVDDMDMEISHVVRGDDHLNNTPRQKNMLAAAGAEPPVYAHLPMILGSDGAKLSKRHGAVNILDYRDEGYLPDAMLNYLVRLGWSHGDQEIFSRDEMIELFDLNDVNASASAFNPEKLRWINQQHIIAYPEADLGELLIPFLEREGYDLTAGPAPAAIAGAYRERAETLVDMSRSCRYCFVEFHDFEAKAAKKHLRPVIGEALGLVRAGLAQLDDWQAPAIGNVLERVAVDLDIGLGKVGQPLRVAVTGGPVSPPIDVTLALVAKDVVLSRIDRAMAFIEQRSQQ